MWIFVHIHHNWFISIAAIMFATMDDVNYIYPFQIISKPCALFLGVLINCFCITRGVNEYRCNTIQWHIYCCDLHNCNLRNMAFTQEAHMHKRNQFTFAVSSYTAGDTSDRPFLLNRSARILSCRDQSPWLMRLIVCKSIICCFNTSATRASGSARHPDSVLADDSLNPTCMWYNKHSVSLKYILTQP